MLFTQNPVILVLLVPVLLIVVTVHEYAHARMAYHFGDHTAKRMGRMNLNPINHLDPIGTLMIMIAGFGWAKPVPINPSNFRSYRSGLLWVSFAGPLANFTLAFIVLLLFALLSNIFTWHPNVTTFISLLVQINIFIGLFNLIPVPPLDGSKILTALAPRSVGRYLQQIEPYAPIILLLLIVTRVFSRIIYPVADQIMQVYLLVVRFILP